MQRLLCLPKESPFPPDQNPQASRQHPINQCIPRAASPPHRQTPTHADSPPRCHSHRPCATEYHTKPPQTTDTLHIRPHCHTHHVSLTTSPKQKKIHPGRLDNYSSARSGARSWSSATIWPRGKGSRPRRPGIPTAVARTNKRAPMVNAKIHWNWKRCGRVRNWPTPVAILRVSIFSKNRRQM
jgi:hypothetical protein